MASAAVSSFDPEGDSSSQSEPYSYQSSIYTDSLTNASSSYGTFSNDSLVNLSLKSANIRYVEHLADLLETFRDNEVPGPQFFRVQREFSDLLGNGSQSKVFGVNQESKEEFRQAVQEHKLKWPVDKIAIKRCYAPTSMDTLGAQFLAIRLEVLALAPKQNQDHKNIVRLLGWGFCLDTVENRSPTGSSLMPLLILERASTDLSKWIRGYQCTKRHRRNGSTVSRDPERGTGSNIFCQHYYKIAHQLCLDIGNGLQALHQKGFSHGDLKPQNVLIFDNGGKLTAKLCDLGCARGMDGSAEVGSIAGADLQIESGGKIKYAGTRGWIPPEVGISNEIDRKSLWECDIYVYGLVVWSVFCKSGRSPLILDNGTQRQFQPGEILGNAEKDIRAALSMFRKSLQGPVLSLLEKSLQDEPSSRSQAPWLELNFKEESFRSKIESILGINLLKFNSSGATPKEALSPSEGENAVDGVEETGTGVS
ncbi:hypothetical protein ABW20_dc0110368 [Dactylellina cionopaga]|nr:hypothetical protein ABW20_dc0110368 [Dactylellina cionopaga]